MKTIDGYEIVTEDTTAILEECDKAYLLRSCTPYTNTSLVMWFRVSNKKGDDYGVFKTEAEARDAYNRITA